MARGNNGRMYSEQYARQISGMTAHERQVAYRGICPGCGKYVRIKPLFGTMHVCTPR